MQIVTANGTQIRGDLIKQAALRYDLAPVPSTFEAIIRVDDDLSRQLADGSLVNVNGDDYQIIKPEKGSGRESQGNNSTDTIQITALLNACAPIAFVRRNAIIKENVLLTEIYRAAGAAIRPVVGDFRTDRFTCMVGQTPSFPIANLLQEEGGVVRWKKSALSFFRVSDLFNQTPALILPDNATENIKSGFLERHEIPWFYSTAPDGSLVYGNQTKARTAVFVPRKNRQQLFNLSRCLVQRKISKIEFNEGLFAGDLIAYQGAASLVIVTAAHVFQSNTDGSGGNQYTKLWLSAMGGG